MKERRRGPPGGGLSGSRQEGFERLQKGLTGERRLIGVSYMDDPEMLRSYLDYYWPVSREQARHALARSRAFFRRVIDLGSGPGPVAAAFADAGAQEIVLVDQSRRALDLALAEIPKRSRAGASLASVVSDISSPPGEKIPLWGKADCVSFGHSLNELFAGDADRVRLRADLLGLYAKALAPGGYVLVIEPALLSTSRDLLAVRNLLVLRGWRVACPCVGRETASCPALEAGESHTCHEEIQWSPPPSVSRLASGAGLDKESLKMTWFMLEPPGKNPVTEADGARVSAEAQDLTGGLYRVVSDPMLNKGGRVRRLVCGRDGRFPLSSPDGSLDAARTGFDRLRRGDVIRVSKPERRENGWGIGPETEIGHL